jgi:hypothetical protein
VDLVEETRIAARSKGGKKMDKLRWWFAHLAVFAVGQAILLAAGASWPAAILSGGVPDPLTLFSNPLVWGSRLWCIVFAADTAWSWAYLVFAERKKGER